MFTGLADSGGEGNDESEMDLQEFEHTLHSIGVVLSANMTHQIYRDIDAQIPDAKRTINRQEFVKYVAKIRPATPAQRMWYVFTHSVVSRPFWCAVLFVLAMCFFVGRRLYLYPNASADVKKALVQAGAFLMVLSSFMGLTLAVKAQRRKLSQREMARLALKDDVYAKVLNRWVHYGNYSHRDKRLKVTGNFEVTGDLYKNTGAISVKGDLLVRGEVYKNAALEVEGAIRCKGFYKNEKGHGNVYCSTQTPYNNGRGFKIKEAPTKRIRGRAIAKAAHQTVSKVVVV